MSLTWQLTVPGSDAVDQPFPFTIGVIADFGGGRREPLARRRFRDVSLDDLNDYFASVGPRLRLAVTDRLSGDMAEITLDLRFHDMSELEPPSVARRIEPLRYLVQAGRGGRCGLGDSVASSDADLLCEMLGSAPAVATDAPPTDDLDAMVSRQLDEVVHHPEFERLEATWRGLHALLMRANGIVGVRVLDVGRDELVRDLARPGGWEKSDLARAVVDGLDADRPFDLFLCDQVFGNAPGDVAVLRGLAGLGALLTAPVVAAASPELLGVTDFADLPAGPDLETVHDGPEFAAWRSLRDSEDSLFLALTLPAAFARVPYSGLDLGGDGEFAYSESGPPPKSSAAWALAGRLAHCADRDGGFDRLSDLDRDLPGILDSAGGRTAKRYAETDFSNEAVAGLRRLGLTPFQPADAPTFAGLCAVHKPKRFHAADADAVSAWSVRLEKTFGVYRLARAAAVVARRLLARTSRPEDGLRDWLSRAVGPDRPLRRADLEWTAIPGSPGDFDLKLTFVTHDPADPGLSLTMPVSST